MTLPVNKLYMNLSFIMKALMPNTQDSFLIIQDKWIKSDFFGNSSQFKHTISNLIFHPNISIQRLSAAIIARIYIIEEKQGEPILVWLISTLNSLIQDEHDENPYFTQGLLRVFLEIFQSDILTNDFISQSSSIQQDLFQLVKMLPFYLSEPNKHIQIEAAQILIHIQKKLPIFLDCPQAISTYLLVLSQLFSFAEIDFYSLLYDILLNFCSEPFYQHLNQFFEKIKQFAFNGFFANDEFKPVAIEFWSSFLFQEISATTNHLNDQLINLPFSHSISQELAIKLISFIHSSYDTYQITKSSLIEAFPVFESSISTLATYSKYIPCLNQFLIDFLKVHNAGIDLISSDFLNSLATDQNNAANVFLTINILYVICKSYRDNFHSPKIAEIVYPKYNMLISIAHSENLKISSSALTTLSILIPTFSSVKLHTKEIIEKCFELCDFWISNSQLCLTRLSIICLGRALTLNYEYTFQYFQRSIDFNFFLLSNSSFSESNFLFELGHFFKIIFSISSEIQIPSEFIVPIWNRFLSFLDINNNSIDVNYSHASTISMFLSICSGFLYFLGSLKPTDFESCILNGYINIDFAVEVIMKLSNAFEGELFEECENLMSSLCLIVSHHMLKYYDQIKKMVEIGLGTYNSNIVARSIVLWSDFFSKSLYSETPICENIAQQEISIINDTILNLFNIITMKMPKHYFETVEGLIIDALGAVFRKYYKIIDKSIKIQFFQLIDSLIDKPILVNTEDEINASENLVYGILCGIKTIFSIYICPSGNTWNFGGEPETLFKHQTLKKYIPKLVEIAKSNIITTDLLFSLYLDAVCSIISHPLRFEPHSQIPTRINHNSIKKIIIEASKNSLQYLSKNAKDTLEKLSKM